MLLTLNIRQKSDFSQIEVKNRTEFTRDDKTVKSTPKNEVGNSLRRLLQNMYKQV